MLFITNNLSYMVIAIFSTSTFVFFTRFFQQITDEMPRIENIIPNSGSFEVAIYSLLMALFTFLLKQATGLKNIETSTKNTEAHLQKIIELWTEFNKEIKGNDMVKEIKNSNETLKKIAIMQKESLRGRSTESLVRRLPQLFDEDEE